MNHPTASYTVFQAIRTYCEDFYRNALQPLIAPLLATNTGVEKEFLRLRMTQDTSLWVTGKFLESEFTFQIQADGKVLFEAFQRGKQGRKRKTKSYDMGLLPLDTVLRACVQAKGLAEHWEANADSETITKYQRAFAYKVNELLLPQLVYRPAKQQNQLLKDLVKSIVIEKMPHSETASTGEYFAENEAALAYGRMIMGAKLSTAQRIQWAQAVYKRNRISMEQLTDILQDSKNKALAQDKDIVFLFPCAASLEQLANGGYWLEKFKTFAPSQPKGKPLVFDTEMLENFTQWSSDLLSRYGQ
ncbi:hypothetical protein SAMN05421780_1206 [Flexibacter flexilis DSM 6793]|uniref:Uncharacterized protein n=1 Tax=Flexibacter flexilis DSM 6793 TaxID=927664 RepID=A0A1I1NV41_9BACT|nr:hypothetical protein [Flexibacter flexilis]SFD01266.1 hypothetical protein SAMN05421780_1206 [Flexibacter flexilis DSM 6793]